jgi:protein-S-isoprenylcysteine O-methyltransferase Ste14
MRQAVSHRSAGSEPPIFEPPLKESAAMSLDTSTEIAQAVAARPRPGRRLFAPPSREGLLICAASLMPAFLFSLMALSNALGLISMIKAGPDEDPMGPAHGWLHLGHQALTTAFSMLICWLFLIRRPSTQSRGAGGWVSDVVAVGGTVIVLALSLAPRTMDDLLALATAEALLTVGLVIMVIGLASLGRSFGIMPRARGLVTGGLYRWVRHPIYLGEFLAFGGILTLTISPYSGAVFVIFVVLQLRRMVMEERTLAEAYPEYTEYCARTSRLLPGVY